MKMMVNGVNPKSPTRIVFYDVDGAPGKWFDGDECRVCYLENLVYFIPEGGEPTKIECVTSHDAYRVACNLVKVSYVHDFEMALYIASGYAKALSEYYL